MCVKKLQGIFLLTFCLFPLLGRKKCAKSELYFINSHTILCHLQSDHSYKHKYCTKFIKQNHKLHFLTDIGSSAPVPQLGILNPVAVVGEGAALTGLAGLAGATATGLFVQSEVDAAALAAQMAAAATGLIGGAGAAATGLVALGR